MAAAKRYSAEQIVAKLREHEKLRAGVDDPAGLLSRTGFDGDCFSWFLSVGGGQILGSERPAGSSRRPPGWARS